MDKGEDSADILKTSIYNSRQSEDTIKSEAGENSNELYLLREELKEVKEENKSQRNRINRLTTKFKDVNTKLDLVSKILSAKIINDEYFTRFSDLINKDFIKFTNREKSLTEEAESLLKLQAIEKRIEMFINFSGIYDKTIITVGGGFSAGKSEFISSFFKDQKITLPIGIKPVTAIPTYIISGRKNKIKGLSKNGGVIEIPPELYAKLSHDFVKSFSFNLKDIMPAMVVETPFDFKNICFIDTPGYDPANTIGDFMEKDKTTSKEILEKSNIIFWLVGVDSNGTIPQSDIDFLENLHLENKKLYIIANKADLKSKDDIENILDEFMETLDSFNIEYEGISAYSSINNAEIAFRKISLLKFLTKQNHSTEIHKQIIVELEEIFDSYKNAIERDILVIKKINKNIKSLKLDIEEEIDFSDIKLPFFIATTSYNIDDSKIFKRIKGLKNELEKQFDINEYKKQLEELAIIKNKIINVVNKIFINRLKEEPTQFLSDKNVKTKTTSYSSKKKEVKAKKEKKEKEVEAKYNSDQKLNDLADYIIKPFKDKYVKLSLNFDMMSGYTACDKENINVFKNILKISPDVTKEIKSNALSVTQYFSYNPFLIKNKLIEISNNDIKKYIFSLIRPYLRKMSKLEDTRKELQKQLKKCNPENRNEITLNAYNYVKNWTNLYYNFKNHLVSQLNEYISK